MFSVKTLLIGIYVINLKCIHNVTNDHILSSFMTYHLITDASCGAGTAFPQFTLYFSEVRGVRFLVFCLIFCISLFFLCSVYFGLCIVCTCSIHVCGFLLWYLQTIFIHNVVQFVSQRTNISVTIKMLSVKNIVYISNTSHMSNG